MTDSYGISRRTFARRVLMGVPALILNPDAALGQNSHAKNRSLSATEPQEMGPYHRDGSPMTKALCPAQTPGRHLAVSGRVLAEGTGDPLADVVIDVWQADSLGKYDFQDQPQPKSPDKYRMRGLMLSDRDGRYSFQSVLPGNYGTSPFQQRARHIHYLIRRTGYEPLITQLYFEGDPWNQRDPLVRKSLIMPIRSGAGGSAHVSFDIVLQRERIINAATLRSFGDFLGEYALDDKGHTGTIEWRGGKLVAIVGKDVNELRYKGGTRFFDPENATHLTFVRNEHGEISELLADFDDGSHRRAKKIR